MKALVFAPVALQGFSPFAAPPSPSKAPDAGRRNLPPTSFLRGFNSRHSARDYVGKGSAVDFRGQASRLKRFNVFVVQATVNVEKWLLQHVGEKDSASYDGGPPLPSVFELTTDAITVGRESDEAQILIPVATVSRVHARLEKKDGGLYVTDLESTNGTYIDKKKISPGVGTPVLPGSCLGFGDQRLAIFQFSKEAEEIQAAETEQSSTEETKTSE